MDTVQTTDVTKPEDYMDQLVTALAKAQSEIVAPLKTCKVDFTNNKGQRVKYSYADLNDVNVALKPLHKYGIAITHELGYTDDGKYGMTTYLRLGKAYIKTWYPLPDPDKQEIRAQEFGSALTYARRYSLSSLCGIASEEDDDGASAPPTSKSSARKPVHNYANEPKFDPSEPKEFTEARRRREEAEREADRLLNLKSKSPPPYLDQALASDPMPNYESDPEPITLLDQLVRLAEKKSIPHAEMASIIRRVTGSPRKAKDLSQEELSKVLNFVDKFVSQKTE